MRRKKIGVMDIQRSVDITDPCYDRDVWCRMDGVPIKSGKYTCIIWRHRESYEIDDELHISNIVGIIGIYLNGVIPPQKSMERIGSIGVDAGLAGFFHNKPDFTDAQWSAFCEQVRKGDAWITDLGFFSSSGYGDGGYDVFAAKTNGENTALEIRFV